MTTPSKTALALALTLASLSHGVQAQVDAPDTPTAPTAPPTSATPATLVTPDVPRAPEAALEEARIGSSFVTVLMDRERVVKGAPYCAQAVHETVQPLVDGNRIVHKQASLLCRDGEGRTRQEIDRPGRRMVYLRDPVGGENWLLDPDKKTARYLGGRIDVNVRREEAERQREYAERQKDYADRMREYAERMRGWAREHAEALRERFQRDEGGTAADARAAARAQAASEPRPRPPAPPAPPMPPRAVVIAPGLDRQDVRIIQINGPEGAESPMPPIPAAVALRADRLIATGDRARAETLPARKIDGLDVTGQRFTSLIEAGKIGNEKPIAITTEVWYSKELQLTVSSAQKDPRSGEQNYALKDIRRGEPDAALMKIPADYRRIGQKPEPGAQPAPQPKGGNNGSGKGAPKSGTPNSSASGSGQT